MTDLTAGTLALFTYPAVPSAPDSDWPPELVTVAGPYTRGMDGEWLITRADGSTLAVQGQHLIALDVATLDAMTTGFVRTALWTDAIPLERVDSGETGGLENLEPTAELREKARETCARFLAVNADDIQAHMNALGDPDGGHPGEYVGHTFYLEAAGHGVGFTDRACSVPLDSTIEAERAKALAELEANGGRGVDLANRVDALDLALALERLSASTGAFPEVEWITPYQVDDETVGLA